MNLLLQNLFSSAHFSLTSFTVFVTIIESNYIQQNIKLFDHLQLLQSLPEINADFKRFESRQGVFLPSSNPSNYLFRIISLACIQQLLGSSFEPSLPIAHNNYLLCQHMKESRKKGGVRVVYIR